MAKPYATLRAEIPAANRRRAARRGKAILAQLRRQERLTQAELAKTLGVSQAAVSKLERQADMTIGRLRRYVEAAGGRLDIVARFARRTIRLDHLGGG